MRSLANSARGVLHAVELGNPAIGRRVATAEGLADKHDVKQVDRRIVNAGIDVEDVIGS